MDKPHVVVRKEGSVATMMIDRPEAMNAYSDRTLTELRDTLRRLATDDSVGVVVVRGAGERAFCAGHDLKDLPVRRAEGGGFDTPIMIDLVELLCTLPKPTIAAVKGYVRGGGNWMAASCDIVIGAEDATFSMPEILFESMPVVAMIPVMRRIGRSRLFDMIITADKLDAREAHEVGLIDRLVPVDRFWDTVYEVATKVGSRDAQAVRAGKEALALLVDSDMIASYRRLLPQAHLEQLQRDGRKAGALIQEYMAGARGRAGS